ncbi:MAG: alpha-L-fucosidase [Cyclobacteriaceae bacterium]
MHKTLYQSLLILLLLSACQSAPEAVEDIPPMPVVPSPQQIAYQEQELIGFLHFTVNTFTDREWGDGTESPSIFNPTEMDVQQWVQTAKEAGMKTLIITAKHHDGFCLWPSALTDHSVAGSPWKDGQGDVLKELSEACQAAGIRLGVYLSPWDRNQPKYGTDEYNQYYLDQLNELLTQYGPIAEVWMDGAKGADAKDMEYDFEAYRKLIYEKQPDALIFSDAGPDIRWIGNEHGFAGETNWSMIDNSNIEIGKADTKYLNTGDPQGNRWIVGECDVSIRPGWFYHASEDSLVKSPQQLVDIFYKSVGRNGTLLLNLPPDRRGLVHENDVASLKEFRSILDETFAHNLALGKTATADNYRQAHPYFSPQHLLDEDDATYWATDEGLTSATLEIDLGDATRFDRILLQEPIRFGQRISAFRVEVQEGKQWKEVAKATTVGYKRLLRIPEVEARKVRIIIEDALDVPALSGFGLYKASEREGKVAS